LTNLSAIHGLQRSYAKSIFAQAYHLVWNGAHHSALLNAFKVPVSTKADTDVLFWQTVFFMDEKQTNSSGTNLNSAVCCPWANFTDEVCNPTGTYLRRV